MSLLTSSAVTALNKEREVIDLDSVRGQERLGYRIKIQSQASSTRQVGFQEVGSLSALLVLSNNLPWQEEGSLSLCPVMARVRFSQQGHELSVRRYDNGRQGTASSRPPHSVRLRPAFYPRHDPRSTFHGPMSDGPLLRALPPSLHDQSAANTTAPRREKGVVGRFCAKKRSRMLSRLFYFTHMPIC